MATLSWHGGSFVGVGAALTHSYTAKPMSSPGGRSIGLRQEGFIGFIGRELWKKGFIGFIQEELWQKGFTGFIGGELRRQGLCNRQLAVLSW